MPLNLFLHIQSYYIQKWDFSKVFYGRTAFLKKIRKSSFFFIYFVYFSFCHHIFITFLFYILRVLANKSDTNGPNQEFDTLKSKKVPQSLEIGLFFLSNFYFYYIVIFGDMWYNSDRGDYCAYNNIKIKKF